MHVVASKYIQKRQINISMTKHAQKTKKGREAKKTFAYSFHLENRSQYPQFSP